MPPTAALTASDLGLDQASEEPLHVFDLPQLYSKPSASILLSTLADLRSEPPSWQATPRSGTPRSTSGASTPARPRRKIKSEGVPAYLTKIIGSPLVWIESEDDRERIWDLAAKRLSERSGRTAIGDITRSFHIPLSAKALQDDLEEAAYSDNWIEITLHEPALAADSLGLKTWASSYLLASRLCLLHTTLPPLNPNAFILELGAGTGLVGIAAAAVFQRPVILTDLPAIVPNLERNISQNNDKLGDGDCLAATLDWIEPEELVFLSQVSSREQAFPLILAADPVYDAEQPGLLVKAIEYHLERDENARVIIELPLREGFAAERQDLRNRMEGFGLEIREQGEEVGYDDWTDHEGEMVEVRCWWGVWGWKASALLSSAP
ncbi:Protein-lysine N-methyltransferase rrg1 [Oleoguttula sp. CCFEE 5521]